MSQTKGGNKSKRFEWKAVGSQLIIQNEQGREHIYDFEEIQAVLKWLSDRFGNKWFPLANNVKLMGNGIEQPVLGMAILDQRPKKDITHAQGSSYLGVVLEEAGILRWNGAARGIKWKIVNMPSTRDAVMQALKKAKGLTVL